MRKRAEKKLENSEDETQADHRPRARVTAKMRVAHIVGLMAREAWERGGPQVAELAEQWEVAETTVRNDAAEASRLLDVFYRDGDRVEEYCRIRLHEIAEQDGPDRVAALTVRLKNLGRLADKHDVTLHQAPTHQLVTQVLPQILEDPELRRLFLVELERHGEQVSERARGLLTTGKSLESED